MAISGRVPLLVLLGLLPVVLRPSFGTMWLWLLAVALAVAVDVLLAPKPALLEITRRPTAPVRMGDPTSSTLVVANPTGAGSPASSVTPGSRPPAPTATGSRSG